MKLACTAAPIAVTSSGAKLDNISAPGNLLPRADWSLTILEVPPVMTTLLISDVSRSTEVNKDDIGARISDMNLDNWLSNLALVTLELKSIPSNKLSTKQ